MATSHLLVIDPQNDFCDIPTELLPQRLEAPVPGQAPARLTERPALPVPGAHADMLRLAGLVAAAGQAFAGITVTLDSHPYLAVERTSFWTDAAGQALPAFTQIAAADLEAGRVSLRFAHQRAQVLAMLRRLEAAGRYQLMVWPIHCVTGSWGHNIHSSLAAPLNHWEAQSGLAVHKVLKGEYPLAEHYGVFEAETPLPEVPSTCFNEQLARSLTDQVDRLFVAGQAASHCVAASVEQLIRYRRGDARGIVLLSDAMSPVAGFERQAQAFVDRAVAAGAQCMSCAQAIDALRA